MKVKYLLEPGNKPYVENSNVKEVNIDKVRGVAIFYMKNKKSKLPLGVIAYKDKLQNYGYIPLNRLMDISIQETKPIPIPTEPKE